MARRIGVVAGSGHSPFHICEEAQKKDYFCVIAGINGEADPDLQEKGDLFAWFNLSQITDLIAYFKANRIVEAVFAGKIDPKVIFQKQKLGMMALNLLNRGKDRTASNIIEQAIGFFARKGIEIIDATPYIASAYCKAGILTSRKLASEVSKDIDFGWPIARSIADLDIGQSVIVKNRAVVAVEGMEGTDKTILRGGEIAGQGIVLIKVSRTQQDTRIDLPAIGLKTMESLARVKAKALCFEADKMPFFQQEQAISLAEKHKITILAKK